MKFSGIMIKATNELVNYSSIKIDSTSKKVLLCVLLAASDRIAFSLAYSILKKLQIPLDICTKPIPDKVWTLFDRASKKNGQAMWIISSQIQASIQYIFPSLHQLYQEPLARIVVGPIYEELLCRMVLQEFFLRKIPRLILAEKGHLVDLKKAKVFRIVLSSTIFALLHTDLWGKGYFVRAGINAQFIGGVTYGIMTEQTHGVLYSSLMHMLHNLYEGRSG